MDLSLLLYIASLFTLLFASAVKNKSDNEQTFAADFNHGFSAELCLQQNQCRLRLILTSLDIGKLSCEEIDIFNRQLNSNQKLNMQICILGLKRDYQIEHVKRYQNGELECTIQDRLFSIAPKFLHCGMNCKFTVCFQVENPLRSFCYEGSLYRKCTESNHLK